MFTVICYFEEEEAIRKTFTDRESAESYAYSKEIESIGFDRVEIKEA